MARPLPRRRGFTLVELLVVIGVIALLISMLMPALGKVRDKALTVKCASNMRQIYLACQMFAQEHKDHLPRCSFARDDAGGILEVDNVCHWAVDEPGRANFQYGALWRYIKGDEARAQIVLCPGDNGEQPRYGSLTPVTHPEGRNFSYSFNAATMGEKDYQMVHGWLAQWVRNPVPGTSRSLGIRLGSVKSAAERIFIFEEIGPNDTLCLDPLNNEDDTPSGRHMGQKYTNALRTAARGSPEYMAWSKSGRGNHVFFDGHVETLTPDNIFANKVLTNGALSASYWWPLW